MKNNFKKVWLFRMLMVLLFAGGNAAAQATQPDTPEETDPENAEQLEKLEEIRIREELEQKMSELVSRMEGLESELKERTLQLQTVEKERDEADARQVAEQEKLTKEIGGLTEQIDQLRKTPTSGYDAGFYIRDPDKKMSLKLTGFARPAYTLVIEQQYDHDALGIRQGSEEAERIILENGMRVLSSRLALSLNLGNAVSAHFSVEYGRAADAPIYSKQYEKPRAEGLLGDRSLSPRLRVLDLYAQYDIHENIQLRAGQLKVPFDKESAFEPTESPFVENSLLTHRYRLYGDRPLLTEGDYYYRQPYEVARSASFGRDVGADASANLWDQKFKISVGVFNGAGVGTENDNRDVLAALRIEGAPLGAMTPGIADTTGADRPLLTLGVAAAFDLLEHQSAYVPSRRYNSADYNLTADLHLKWRGMHALGVFFFRHADHGGGIFEVNTDSLNETPVNSYGGMFQLGYYWTKAGLLPTARYAYYDARLDRSNDHVHQATAALNYIVIPKHFRMILDYSALIPVQKKRSYLAPYAAHADIRHDISILAEVAF